MQGPKNTQRFWSGHLLPSGQPGRSRVREQLGPGPDPVAELSLARKSRHQSHYHDFGTVLHFERL